MPKLRRPTVLIVRITAPTGAKLEHPPSDVIPSIEIVAKPRLQMRSRLITNNKFPIFQRIRLPGEALRPSGKKLIPAREDGGQLKDCRCQLVLGRRRLNLNSDGVLQFVLGVEGNLK